jgi:hypothetical protein
VGWVDGGRAGVWVDGGGWEGGGVKEVGSRGGGCEGGGEEGWREGVWLRRCPPYHSLSPSLVLCTVLLHIHGNDD